MKTSEITAIFDADLARVWEAVSNNADCGWRSDLSGIEITGENTFTEFANNGFPTYFTITEKRENELYELDIDNKNFFGHWTGKFRALEGGGTEVTFTESLRVKNPLMRALAALFMNVRKFQLRYAEDLSAKLKEDKN